MNHATRTELMLMALDLRLGARTPSSLVAHRLTPHRLGEIASVLEAMIAEGDVAASILKPANDPQSAKRLPSARSGATRD